MRGVFPIGKRTKDRGGPKKNRKIFAPVLKWPPAMPENLGGPGTGLVSYKLTAIRSTQAGSPGYFAVRFGAGNQATIVEVGVDQDEAA